MRFTLIAVVLAVSSLVAAPPQLQEVLDRDATRWIDRTFEAMTLDDKVGQLVFTAANTDYLASDTDAFIELRDKVRLLKLGGITVFGSSEPAPRVLPDDHYGTVTLGEALATASLLNRLQDAAAVPLLTTADFEAGVPFRIRGGTRFPRAMAVAAAADDALVFDSARVTAVEGRAIGVHVNLAPVTDVNNNPRNPVINTRSFGETAEVVGRMTASYVRGLRAGGMLSTLKHFPGHGDTDIDSHIGLPTVTHPRARLDSVELWPFRFAMSEGADAVMTAHIVLPALDPGEFSPASLSRPIVTDLLRGELGFNGLVFTDALDMGAIVARLRPGEAAARAIQAGNDVVLKSPDDAAAVAGIKAAVERGDIPMEQLDASVRRVLRAKARLRLHEAKRVSLDDVPTRVGGRAHQDVADRLGQQSITLLKDDRNQVPLRVPRDASVLYLSLLDYPSGWRIQVPSATALAELRKRWPNITAVELSDRSSPGEIDLIRASAPEFDAIVAAVFVRTASGSGRMDLPPALADLLATLARRSADTPRPFVTIFFGNPYAAMDVPSLPAVLLAYDFYDLAERSAVRALVGDAPISGRLPVTLPGLFEAGHGLVR